MRGTASVVVCTRDRPELLRRALASVLPQLRPGDEVIVVDDGSLRTEEVGARCVRVVRTAGLGPAGARAAGLAAARGTYIAWCDDDDEWLPGHLEILTSALDRDTRIDLVYGDVEWQADGHQPSVPPSLDFEGYVLAEWNCIPISAVVHRADSCRRVGGFDPHLAACEDWDLWLRLAEAGGCLRHQTAVVSRQHWHPSSHASSPGETHAEAYVRVFDGHRARTATTVEPFDPSTWTGLRQLVCRAVLRRYEGYGVVSRKLLQALGRRGIGISMLPEGDQPPAGTDHLYKQVPGRNRLALYYDYRSRPAEMGFDRVVFYTMWESTRVPDSLVSATADCAMVLVPCRQNAEAFAEAQVEAPIRVLHHGIDPDEFPVLERARRHHFTFGTFGHLSPRKGSDVLLKAFLEEFGPGDDARLVLKSSGDAGVYGTDDPRVRVMSGGVEGAALLQILRAFDAMVLPSRGEGFGLCGLEAMATGLPVIATDWSGPAEYLDPSDSLPLSYRLVDAAGTESNRVEYHGQWAEPDVDDLRAKMRWLYEHPENAARMGHRAARRVHRDWTWDRMAADLHGYLDEAAAGEAT